MSRTKIDLSTLFNVIGGGQGGMYLGPGTTGRMEYIQPFVENPEYDKDNPYGIDPETERVVVEDGKRVVIGEDAPRGVGRVIAGIMDKIDPSRDRDQRGSGADKWGDLPDEGYGREAILVDPGIPNPEYPGNPNLPGAGPVPQISRKGQIEQVLSQEYQIRRANANTAYMMDQMMPRLKEANYYAYQLDRAKMYDYMNSPRGQAETSLKQQQALAVPRFAKAALIEARAKSQEAANEFGKLGLERTITPGISAGSIA